MSTIRRQRREELRNRQKMMNVIHDRFKERIKGKSREQILEILEEIRIKYGIEQPVQYDNAESSN